jgi:hypothetical protein
MRFRMSAVTPPSIIPTQNPAPFIGKKERSHIGWMPPTNRQKIAVVSIHIDQLRRLSGSSLESFVFMTGFERVKLGHTQKTVSTVRFSVSKS